MKKICIVLLYDIKIIIEDTTPKTPEITPRKMVSNRKNEYNDILPSNFNISYFRMQDMPCQ